MAVCSLASWRRCSLLGALGLAGCGVRGPLEVPHGCGQRDGQRHARHTRPARPAQILRPRPADPLTGLQCTISATVGGVLHAEGVSLARIAEAVGTPFYCYATATLERHYRVLQQAFAGLDTLICYAVKANSNQAVIATLARLGAGMDVVSEGELRRARAAGVPADQDHLRRRRQDARGDGLRAGRGHPGLQRRVRARAGGAERGGGEPRPHGAHRPARQSRRRRQDARQDLHRQGREQVRRTLRGCAAPLRQGGRACPASRSTASTCTSAARSPTWRRSATPSR